MTKWIPVTSEVKPEPFRHVIAYCPEWNQSGYEVCYWNGSQFWSDDACSDDFDGYVEQWSLFMEADATQLENPEKESA